MIVIVVFPAMVTKRKVIVEMIRDVCKLVCRLERRENERVDDVELKADDAESNLRVTDESLEILGFKCWD